nr:ribonuclease III [Eubacterium sp.]
MEPKITLLDTIHQTFDLDRRDINTYSPLTLAYLGDAVYEIIIRTLIVEGKEGAVNTLHRRSSKLVNAGAQATIFNAIESQLLEEELAVYRRGRNAKSHSVAKNASIHDYRMATGFEALMGYLYLIGDMNRAIALVRQGLTNSDLLSFL